MNKYLIGLLAAVTVLGGTALAQNYESGSVPLASPTGAERLAVRGLGPQFESVSLAQIRDASGYALVVEGATNNVQIANNTSVLAFTGATAGTATAIFPPAPFDGERMQVFSQAGVTTLTLTGSGTQTVNNAAISLAANGSVEYIYQLSSNSWTRIQ